MKYLSIIFILIFAFSAHAATYNVTLSTDRFTSPCENTCSLREAINSANLNSGNDTITFAPGITAITMTGSEMLISNNGTLTIAGSGADVLTISGNGAARIFRSSGANVTITDLTLTGGIGVGTNSSGVGGAILVEGGTLTLDRVRVTGNSAAGSGGGVRFQNGANHRILNSTFDNNNSASGYGGAFFNDAATLLIVNSTFAGNSAGVSGGAFTSGANAVTTLRSVTITNNSSDLGGGFRNSGTVNIVNSIVSGNSANTNYPEIYNSDGTAVSNGNNLIGDGANDSANTFIGISYQTSDVRDVNPLLGALQNNGGTTPTIALLTRSPATDTGSNMDAPLTDQRGMSRIVGTAIDIGAFENQAPKPNKRVRIIFQ